MKITRRSFCTSAASLAIVGALPARAYNAANFKPVPTQFLAALGEPGAKSGTGAETWGLWEVDPGPRGVRLDKYNELAKAGIAPAQWKFDAKSWWLEEHGLIMEQPTPSVLAGRFIVTGDRAVETMLTIYPKDASGSQRWELADGATLYDVTHLRCRAARYTTSPGSKACTPGMVDPARFPVPPGDAMPLISGCDAQDFAVLFIIGVEA
jgi:hypothetical protein